MCRSAKSRKTPPPHWQRALVRSAAVIPRCFQDHLFRPESAGRVLEPAAASQRAGPCRYVFPVAVPQMRVIFQFGLRNRRPARLEHVKVISLLALLMLSACDRPPKVVQWSPQAEPARESVIESVQKVSAADVAKEAQPYRTWLIAQRTGICEQHHAKMSRHWIPVAYGLPMPGSFPEVGAAAAFPHGQEFRSAGCIVTATKEREVFLCPQCVAAYRGWKEKQKPNSEGSTSPQREAGPS